MAARPVEPGPMTPEPLRYEVDGEEFLDRMRRTRALNDELQRAGHTIDVQTWAARMKAILREVDQIPLVIGVRYRMVTFGGSLEVRHRHYRGDDGEVHGLDVPSIADAGMVEVEGVYLGRHPDGPWRGLIALDLGGGQTTAIADTDVLRCEEIR